MRIIDRYVIRETLLPFTLALLVFTFILVIPFLVQYAESFIAKGVSVAVVLRVMATLLPQALALAIPAALLTGLLVAFGRLSADREFVAMQACGLGLVRLLRPVMLMSVGAWAATSYVMLVALPQANDTFKRITFNIVANRAEGEVKPRTFFLGFPDLALYVGDVPTAGGWEDVFLADNRPGQSAAVYVARHGQVILDEPNRTVEMVLEQGARHTSGADGQYEVIDFKRLVLSVDPDAVFPRTGPQKGDNEMTIPELRARAAELEAQGQPSHGPLMAIHRKFSIPVACLVFGLIGVGLGATNRRGGKMGSFVFGLGGIFAYYVPLFLGPAMAKGNLVEPWFAVWLPNFLLGGAGVVLLLRRARSADQPLFWFPDVPALFQRLRDRVRSSAPGVSPPTLPRALHVGSILDRYIAGSYLRVFVIAAAAMLGLFYVSTFLDLSDKVFKGQATWTMLAQYMWYITPQYTYYALPMGVLLATLVTIGLLTKNSELVVMKACGVSLYRIALPMVAISMAVGGLLFAIDQSVLGPSNRSAEAIRHVMRGGSLDTFDVVHRQWTVGHDGRFYHYTYFDPATRQLLGLSVYQVGQGAQALSSRVYAERASYERASTWLADRGWARTFDDRGDTVTLTSLESAPVALDPVETFSTQLPDPKFMSYAQLRDYVEELRSSGVDVTTHLVAMQRKLAFPFVTIIMTLIGVPFAVTTGRRGALYGVGVGLVLAIGYWVAMSVFGAFGSGGLLTPAVAAWAPNLLFGAGATYLLLTVRT